MPASSQSSGRTRIFRAAPCTRTLDAKNSPCTNPAGRADTSSTAAPCREASQSRRMRRDRDSAPPPLAWRSARAIHRRQCAPSYRTSGTPRGGACHRGLGGETGMHPRQPGARLPPHVEVADLRERRPGHALEKEPVAPAPLVDRPAVEAGRVDAERRENRFVGRTFTDRVVEEPRLDAPRVWQHRGLPRVLAHEVHAAAIVQAHEDLLERKARGIRHRAGLEIDDAAGWHGAGQQSIQGVAQLTESRPSALGCAEAFPRIQCGRPHASAPIRSSSCGSTFEASKYASASARAARDWRG